MPIATMVTFSYQETVKACGYAHHTPSLGLSLALALKAIRMLAVGGAVKFSITVPQLATHLASPKISILCPIHCFSCK
jgi:hypothetical protein